MKALSQVAGQRRSLESFCTTQWGERGTMMKNVPLFMAFAGRGFKGKPEGGEEEQKARFMAS
jgi:hypothetical protein